MVSFQKPGVYIAILLLKHRSIIQHLSPPLKALIPFNLGNRTEAIGLAFTSLSQLQGPHLLSSLQKADSLSYHLIYGLQQYFQVYNKLLLESEETQ